MRDVFQNIILLNTSKCTIDGNDVWSQDTQEPMEFGLSGVPYSSLDRWKIINMNNLNFSLCFTQSQNMTLEDLKKGGILWFFITILELCRHSSKLSFCVPQNKFTMGFKAESKAKL